MKCINYFKPKSVGFEYGNELLKKKVKDEFPSLSFKEPFEIKYYGALVTESQILAMANYAKQQPKGIIYIGDIRKNTYTIELWDKLILSDFVTVSVDMYFGGLLFFHKTQAREHFKIRI
ncbi:MAG: hypothetical protein WBN20_13080 [Eudoraea sp.]|uniref:hypothetical protein n=1 Tax=Eudoraea sp. TaxID=1979955 RepID=UPI003C712BB1